MKVHAEAFRKKPVVADSAMEWRVPSRIPTSLQTPRLLIRSYLPEDAHQLLEIFAVSPDFFEYDDDFKEYDLEKCQEYVTRNHDNYHAGKQFSMVIVERSTGMLLGETGLWGGWAFQKTWPGEADTGFNIRADRRREGFAMEAVQAVITAAFQPQEDGGWGFRRITITQLDLNIPSRKLAEKLRMRLEKSSKESVFKRRYGWCGETQFSVLAHEWDATLGKANSLSMDCLTIHSCMDPAMISKITEKSHVACNP